MIISLFDELFENLALNPCASQDIESIVNLWLSLVHDLSEDSKEKPNSKVVPLILLPPTAIASLLKALLNCGPHISLKCWGSVLYLFTLNNNTTNSKGAKIALIEDPNFVPVLVLFLTTNFGVGDDSKCSEFVGCSISSLFHNLLVRLTICCDCFAATSENGNKLKVLLLEVVARLLRLGVGDSGSNGPLDAQCILMRHLTKLHFAWLEEINLMLEIVNKTAVVIHKHVQHKSQAGKFQVSTQGSTSIGSSRSELAINSATCGPTGNSSLLSSYSSSEGIWGGLTLGPNHSSLPRPKTETFLYTLLALNEILLETPLGGRVSYFRGTVWHQHLSHVNNRVFLLTI